MRMTTMTARRRIGSCEAGKELCGEAPVEVAPPSWRVRSRNEGQGPSRGHHGLGRVPGRQLRGNPSFDPRCNLSRAHRTVDEFAVRPGILLQSTLWWSIGSMHKERTGGPSGSRMFVSHLILQPPHLSRRLTSRVRYRSGLPFSFFPLDLAPHGRTRPLSPNGKLSFRRRGEDSYPCWLVSALS